MRFETFYLPAHWAAPLINDDHTGLDDDELGAVAKFSDDVRRMFGRCHCVTVRSQNNFTKWHDAAKYGVLACNVDEFYFDTSDPYPY